MPWRAGHREAWFQFWGEKQASRVLRRMDSPPEDGLSQTHSRVALWEKRRQGELLTGHDSFLDGRISSDPARSPSVKCRNDETSLVGLRWWETAVLLAETLEASAMGRHATRIPVPPPTPSSETCDGGKLL